MQIKCLPLRAQILTAIYRFKKKNSHNLPRIEK